MADRKLKRHPHVKSKILPDGYLLLWMDNSVYTLTPLGGLVWEFCDGNNALQDIVDCLSEIKEVNADTSLKDTVAGLMSTLKQTGLLVT
jgi:hypothetical protein